MSLPNFNAIFDDRLGSAVYDDKSGVVIVVDETDTISYNPVVITDDIPFLPTDWWKSDAILDYDFVNGRYFGVPSLAQGFTLSRSTVAMASSTTNVWQQFASGAMRIVSGRGWLFEKATTNQVRNSTMAGAVAGTPGTSPNNWQVSGLQGTTQTISLPGAQDGIDTIRYRFAGTPTATGSLYIMIDNQTMPATAGAWTCSAFLKLFAGTFANVGSPRLIMQEYTSTNTYVGSTTLGNLSLTSTWTRIKDTLTAVGTAGNYLRLFLQFNFTINQAVDFTIDIGIPQVEAGTFPTAPHRTTAGSGTRNTDDAILVVPAGTFSMSGGSLYFEFEDLVGNIATDRYLFWVETGSNDKIFVRMNSTGRLEYVVINNNLIQAQLLSTNTLQAGQIYKFAIRWAANNFAIRVTPSLGSPANDVSGLVPTAGTLNFRFGSAFGGASSNAYVRRATIWNKLLSDSELAALVA